MELSDLSKTLRETFDAKTAAREQGLSAARSAIRSCGNAIRALHRYETQNADGLIDEAQHLVDEARSALADHPDLLHAGFVHDAEKELAEARITHALVTGADLPTPASTGIPVQAFTKGMAESIGEIRRHILDLMRRGELERCEELLRAMDDIYYVLVSMDYPDGITMGLRRLTDVARSIIERTRGDFTTSVIQRSLQAALQEHASHLGES
ncbi:MAG TPA: haloacid dehalogenase [Actinomycetota bacterium]|nr:haloacid dehalogenase [Actinomycetota bacterium]